MPDRRETGLIDDFACSSPTAREHADAAGDRRVIGIDSPIGDLAMAGLRAAIERLGACQEAAGRGDPAGVHRLRTTVRRLRSELRAFRDLVDPAWRQKINTELKWLGTVLGGVRDLDVQVARLRKGAGALEVRDERALRPLFRILKRQRGRASDDLRRAIESDRFARIYQTLEVAMDHNVLADGADVPCGDELPELAAAAWRRLRKAARSTDLDTPDAVFHEVRKSAKRARYTAEAIVPALRQPVDPTAHRFIELVTIVQNVLGEHQDAVVAIASIERALAESGLDDPAVIRAADRLIATQRTAARAALVDFFRIWDKLDRKKRRRWFKHRGKKEPARSRA
jgi:CHAD domain-containing protein